LYCIQGDIGHLGEFINLNHVLLLFRFPDEILEINARKNWTSIMRCSKHRNAYWGGSSVSRLLIPEDSCLLHQREIFNSNDFIIRSLTHSLTHGVPFLRWRQLCSYSRTCKHLMEPEGSLPWPQEPFTGSYPEPDQSSPSYPILSL
jgi:hypothetical protein